MEGTAQAFKALFPACAFAHKLFELKEGSMVHTLFMPCFGVGWHEDCGQHHVR